MLGQPPPDDLTRLREDLKRAGPLLAPRLGGATIEAAPSYTRIAGISKYAKIGDRIEFAGDPCGSAGEVVALDSHGAKVKLFDDRIAIGLGTQAFLVEADHPIEASGWKGRVIDALCRPVDGMGPLPSGKPGMASESAQTPKAMQRARPSGHCRTGVRAIDLFCPLQFGQRIGIFAGSGVGKSTLLAMLARSEGFDSVVIALVGERGREVREFLDETLGRRRNALIAVVATSDESAMMRRRAPSLAIGIAEQLRANGERVLLIVDSVTRFAHAAREVALAAGEPAVARGYAPSVFSDLPRLLERAGPGGEEGGAITAVFSVLVDGDDHNDPVADCIRGTLDGHIKLDRAIAEDGRYPAIDILGSLSRLANAVWTREQREMIVRLRRLVSRYENTRDLRLIGGYQPGADPELDQAVMLVPRLYQAMQQTPDEAPSRDAFRETAELLATR